MMKVDSKFGYQPFLCTKADFFFMKRLRKLTFYTSYLVNKYNL
jgi:hypothetical protein